MQPAARGNRTPQPRIAPLNCPRDQVVYTGLCSSCGSMWSDARGLAKRKAPDVRSLTHKGRRRCRADSPPCGMKPRVSLITNMLFLGIVISVLDFAVVQKAVAGQQVMGETTVSATVTCLFPVYKRRLSSIAGDVSSLASPTNGNGSNDSDVCHILDTDTVWTQVEAVDYIFSRRSSQRLTVSSSIADTCSSLLRGTSAVLASVVASHVGNAQLCINASCPAGVRNLITMVTDTGGSQSQRVSRLLADQFQQATVSLDPWQLLPDTARDSSYFLYSAPRMNDVFRAIASVVKLAAWESVMVVSSVDELRVLPTTLSQALEDESICVAEWRQFDPADSNSVRATAEAVVNFQTVRGIVLVASARAAEVLFHTLAQMTTNTVSNSEQSKFWIGAGSWTESSIVSMSEFIRIRHGAILVRPNHPSSLVTFVQALETEYEEYLRNLTAADGRLTAAGSLLGRAWEAQFNCTLSCGQNSSTDAVAYHDSIPCSEDLQLSSELAADIASRSRNSLLAAHMVFIALQSLLNDFDSLGSGDATAMDDFHRFATPERILNALRNASFPCNTTADGAIRECSVLSSLAANESEIYRIDALTSPDVTRLGEWSTEHGLRVSFHLEQVTNESIRLANSSSRVGSRNIPLPQSTCRASQCMDGFEPGPALTASSTCCTQCIPCQAGHYSNGSRCMECSDGLTVNEHGNGCLISSRVTIRISGILPAFCIGTFLLGLVFVAVNFFIFYKYRGNHIIRNADVKLIYLLLAGMIPGYFGMALFVAGPRDLFCILRLALARVSLLLTISVVLIKTSRLARIALMSKELKFNRNDRTMRQWAQYLYVFLLVGLGCALLFGMLAFNSATTELDGDDFVCVYPGATIPVSDGYNIILLIVSVILALPLRMLPKGFNRAWLVLMMALCMTVIYAISAISYLTNVNLALLFAIRLFFLLHAAWFAVCFTPLRLLVEELVADKTDWNLSSLSTRMSTMQSCRSTNGLDIALRGGGGAGVNSLRRISPASPTSPTAVFNSLLTNPANSSNEGRNSSHYNALAQRPLDQAPVRSPPMPRSYTTRDSVGSIVIRQDSSASFELPSGTTSRTSLSDQAHPLAIFRNNSFEDDVTSRKYLLSGSLNRSSSLDSITETNSASFTSHSQESATIFASPQVRSSLLLESINESSSQPNSSSPSSAGHRKASREKSVSMTSPLAAPDTIRTSRLTKQSRLRSMSEESYKFEGPGLGDRGK